MSIIISIGRLDAELAADKAERRTGSSYASFKTATDANTDILVQKVAAEIRTIAEFYEAYLKSPAGK